MDLSQAVKRQPVDRADPGRQPVIVQCIGHNNADTGWVYKPLVVSEKHRFVTYLQYPSLAADAHQGHRRFRSRAQGLPCFRAHVWAGLERSFSGRKLHGKRQAGCLTTVLTVGFG